MPETRLSRLATRLGERLQVQGLRLATAESCTGGAVAAVITDVPGSSAWFDRGFVTYSNASKHDLLDVPADLLEKWGAVSEAVVAAMTAGTLAHSPGVDLSVAVSGIAGPGGGTPEKPVGTVCLAWQRRGRSPTVLTVHLPGDRDAVREATTALALEGLIRLLEEPAADK
ncbi:MAG: CinA family protein [Betaproteobacteria bacterium]|nr:CinA family protein [Betaproteobacteria bacterium]MDE2622288.1 CinA family protein [Betaproteobacteria bacterium]